MSAQPQLDLTEPPSDEQLVARVAAGETALFEVLMRRNNQRLYRAVRAILRDGSEAEDVMQQTYLSAFSHLHQFAGDARFSTWLLRIGVNEALGRLRQRGRHLELLKDPEDDAAPLEAPMPTPEERAADHELATLMEGLVDRLPDAYRAVLVLRDIEGHDTDATAELLGTNRAVVKTRLHRARLALRTLLEPHFAATSP